jgi:hypothetical protein
VGVGSSGVVWSFFLQEKIRPVANKANAADVMISFFIFFCLKCLFNN